MTLCVVLPFCWVAVLPYKCAWWASVSIQPLWRPTVGPRIYFFTPCQEAHICKLYDLVLMTPPPPPPTAPLLWHSVLNKMLCDEVWGPFGKHLRHVSVFAVYAVISNGQVECSKGFKRLNLTHCQGKINNMWMTVLLVQCFLPDHSDVCLIGHL